MEETIVIDVGEEAITLITKRVNEGIKKNGLKEDRLIPIINVINASLAMAHLATLVVEMRKTKESGDLMRALFLEKEIMTFRDTIEHYYVEEYIKKSFTYWPYQAKRISHFILGGMVGIILDRLINS